MSDLISVKEYAKVTGKDPGNIRKMLISGKLKGQKVGNQWVILRDEIYPTDRRIKSGRYHNWRKKNEFHKRNPELGSALSAMSNKIGQMQDKVIDEIVLYGSFARGEEKPDSDIDIAVFLKENQTERMHDKMTDIVLDYELDLGITLSVITVEKSNYLEWKKDLPFYKNINKEGIVLWKNV